MFSYPKKKIQQYSDDYFSYNHGFQKQSLKNFFCVIFRHDMDAIDESLLHSFLERENSFEYGSSLFFRLNQIRMFGNLINNIDQEKYEIGLHSEAKPSLLPSRPELSKVIEFMYRRNLNNQIRKANSLLNKKIFGHSPHAFHNYLPFKSAMNWLIIEKATLGVMDYLSSWKVPSYTSQGHEFSFNYEVPYRVNSTESSMTVFSTCWDDKFFSVPEEYEFQGINKNLKTFEEGIKSIKKHMDFCLKNSQPLIINTHPYLWFIDKKYFEFKCRIDEYSQYKKVPILTFREYLERLNT